MIDLPQNSRQLVALMRRSEIGLPLRFVDTPASPWAESLSLKPESMDQATAQVSALTVRLRRGAISATDRMLFRKGLFPSQRTVLLAYARLLSACPEIKGDEGALMEYARKLPRYENIRYRSGRSVNRALDLRLLLGALQAYMLRRILMVVVARIESPACAPAERARLEDKFSGILLHKQQLLQTRQETVAQSTQQKDQLRAQLDDVEKRTLVADVMEAIRQQRPVDQETMETAARYHRELKQKDQAQGTDSRRARR